MTTEEDREFEAFKKKMGPDFFPKDESIEKQKAYAKAMMARLRQEKTEASDNRKKAHQALDKAVEKKTRDRGERAERNKIEQEADRILREGDPIEFIREQFSKIHIGDEIIFFGLLASIGSQLCRPSDGIQPGLTGESGKGKTDSCRAVFHLLPDDYKMAGSFSNKSLFYHLKKPGTVLFFDDAANLSEEIKDMIKQSTSAFQDQFVHRTVDNHGARELPLPARLVYWITTVGGNFELQFLNRQLNLSVDDSTNQDALVMAVTLERYQQGNSRFAISEEVKVCREIFKTLKDREPVTVKIPFAEKVHWNNPKNRRNLAMFLDTINAFAAFRQYRREQDSEAPGTILANRDDFELAKKLWTGISKEQVGKLSKDDLRLLNCIREKGDKSHDGVFTIPRQLAKKFTGFSACKMDLLINGKNGTGGLKEKVEGFDVIKGSKTTGDDCNKRTVHYDELQYDGSLDIFGEFNDLVWIVE